MSLKDNDVARDVPVSCYKFFWGAMRLLGYTLPNQGQRSAVIDCLQKL